MMNTQRGAALLLVLWIVILLGMVAGTLAAASRTEHLLTRNLVEGSRALAAAEAGVHLAIKGLSRAADGEPWYTDGRPYRTEFADASLEIRVTDEAGRIDINYAGAEDLRQRVMLSGAEPAAAEAIAHAIVEWRQRPADPNALRRLADEYRSEGFTWSPRHGAFPSVDELRLVRGMTPKLYDCIADDLTVYGGGPSPSLTDAPPGVLRAIAGLDAAQVEQVVAAREAHAGTPAQIVSGFVATAMATPRPGFVYTVRSTAELPGGHASTVEAVVRLGGGRVRGVAFTVLDWQEQPGRRRRATDCEESTS